MRAFLLAALALVGPLAACRTTGSAREPAFAAEIGERNSELERRFAAGDMLGVADLYADDAVLMGPQGFRIQGREAIDSYWARFAEPVDWRLEIFEIGGSDETAYELGRSHLTLRQEGEPHTSIVDFLVVWKRDEKGAWRIVLDAYWAAPPEGSP